MRVVTIGGYGFDERGFFCALVDAEVDTFVDVRQRRGLRGRKYAFLNSKRLQAELAARGIRYLHLRELAPTTEIRDAQRQRDFETGTGKRARTRLAPEFVSAYREHILTAFGAEKIKAAIGSPTVVAFFCVEGHPDACHRSLVAHELRDKLSVEVRDIQP